MTCSQGVALAEAGFLLLGGSSGPWEKRVRKHCQCYSCDEVSFY